MPFIFPQSSKSAEHTVSNGHREDKVKQEKSRSDDAVKAVSRSRPSVEEVRSTKVSAVAAQEKIEVKKEKEREERKRVRPTSSEGKSCQ